MEVVEFVQGLTEVGPYLPAPIVVSMFALSRARARRKQIDRDDGPTKELDELNNNIKAAEALIKSNQHLINRYRAIAATTKNFARAKAEQIFDEEVLASLSPQQQQDKKRSFLIAKKKAFVVQLAEGKEMAALQQKKRELLASIGKGHLGFFAKVAHSFLNNEVVQTAEGFAMGAALNIVLSSLIPMFAGQGLIDRIADGNISGPDSMVIPMQLLGYGGALFAILKRAIDVKPGQ